MTARRPAKTPLDANQPGQAVALAWLLIGMACPLVFFIQMPPGKLDKPVALVVIYLVSALGLDLFVGASRRVTLQRITPAVVLAMLITPGIPPALALVADLIGTIAVASASHLTYSTIAQAGKSLLPASLTAFLLYTRSELNLDAYFFAAEIFLVASLLTRTTEPPYRSDLFLVVSYPAIGLMLKSLAELHLAYVLLAVPLLFLMTTVDTEMLLRYFQLQQKLDHSQTEIKETRRAQRKTEIESRRKGILLNRKEQQLTLLNGLGREMDAAEAREDLARFLVNETVRLTGAESALVIFSDERGNRAARVLSPTPPQLWGLKEGEAIPPGVQSGIHDREPWPGRIWHRKKSFLTCKLGNEGWLFLASEEKDAFPPFLDEFFSAVGRHAGSAILALRRLTEVRAIAHREAREKERVAEEKEKVAAEKEKVAEQNRNLRLLIENFEGITEGALASDHELLRQGTVSLKRMTGADAVILQARPVTEFSRDESGLLVEGTRWPSYIFRNGTGASGNLLCLSRRPDAFSESQKEWCTLLQDFLDKTMENGSLHREVQASYAQLERTQEEVVLSSQWAAAGRLAANAAHELNTPLGAIRLAAEQTSFFLQKEGASEMVINGVQSIMRSVDRCRQVTDRLLITSRPVDRGESPTEPETQSVLPIVKDAIASVQPYLKASNIKVADHRLVSDFKVKVVIQDLYWAVINVLKNAIDALNEGTGGEKRLAIALESEGPHARITIADNGPGIPEEVKQRIFEPFFTTKKLGQGNGLGLSLSRTNLRRWGGDLKFQDTPGGGATFILTVPLV